MCLPVSACVCLRVFVGVGSGRRAPGTTSFDRGVKWREEGSLFLLFLEVKRLSIHSGSRSNVGK